MKKFFKFFFGTLLIVFVLLQFYPRSNNNISTISSSHDISTVHAVPLPVQQVLITSCYDCHSNNTVYPWYASLQPVSLWLADHVKEGKSELNFSEFGSYSLRRQYRKLEEINGQVKEGEMPLSSYTIIHKNAKLNPEQKLALASWTAVLRDSFKANYPVDSLERKKANK